MEFNEKFLQEMGLSAMPADQKAKFLEYVQRELEIRIGERVSKGLTEFQLNEFDNITEPQEAIKWLEKNRPDYREIVDRTIKEMKDEIRENRNKLVNAQFRSHSKKISRPSLCGPLAANNQSRALHHLRMVILEPLFCPAARYVRLE